MQPYWTVDHNKQNADCMIVRHGGQCGTCSPIDNRKYPTRQLADRAAWHAQQAFNNLTIVVTRHDP